MRYYVVRSDIQYIFPCRSLALPITFKQKLKNLQVQEGHSITLSCEISKPGVAVEWRLAGELLEDGEKYQMKQRGSVLTLTIRDALPEDCGIYACVCRDQKTKATVKVVGMLYSICRLLAVTSLKRKYGILSTKVLMATIAQHCIMNNCFKRLHDLKQGILVP